MNPHLAQTLAQCFFASASVVAEAGLTNINPVFFTFARSLVAIPMLYTLWFLELSICHQQQVERERANSLTNRKDIPHNKLPTPWNIISLHPWQLILASLFLVLGKMGSTVGIKLTSSVTQTIYSPSQQFFALAVGVCLGTETASMLKILGMIFCFISCFFMVAASEPSTMLLPRSHTTAIKQPEILLSVSKQEMIGHIMLVISCMSMACYFVACKSLLKRGYTPLTVVSWAFTLDSLISLPFLFLSTQQWALDVLCPPPDSQCGNGSTLPMSAVFALLYMAIVSTAFAFPLSMYANRHLPPSVLTAYTVLQPVTASLMSLIVVLVTSAPHWGLSGPTATDLLGAIGIFTGLGIVLYDNRLREIEQLEDQKRLLMSDVNGIVEETRGLLEKP